MLPLIFSKKYVFKQGNVILQPNLFIEGFTMFLWQIPKSKLCILRHNVYIVLLMRYHKTPQNKVNGLIRAFSDGLIFRGAYSRGGAYKRGCFIWGFYSM